MSLKAVLIFNPGSGKGLGAARAKDFETHWRSQFGDGLRLRATRSREDIQVAAREFPANENELRIFLGGDGTLSEGLQGLAAHHDFDLAGQPPVGFLPGGTGNSFLRDFGIDSYEKGREQLFSALASSESLAIDAAIIRYQNYSESQPSSRGPEVRRLMFNIFGIGLISEITRLAVKMRYLGPANYQVATLTKILTHRPFHWKMKIDGVPEEAMGNLITLSNSRFTGGAMEIAPDIRVNDGKLFMVRIHARNRLALFQLFPKILRGDYQGESRISTRFIKHLEFEDEHPFLMNIDGELETGFDPRLEISPAFFRLILPKKSVGDPSENSQPTNEPS